MRNPAAGHSGLHETEFNPFRGTTQRRNTLIVEFEF
jgi:hypothetical protein